MKDMMTEVYKALISNRVIKENVSTKQIKFFDAPESLDYSKPFIIIDSLAPISSAYHGSDKPLSQQFKYQINVESPNRLLTKEIAKAVKDTMWSLGFRQLTGGLDTYFKETKRFVDARRYNKNTTIYEVDY